MAYETEGQWLRDSRRQFGWSAADLAIRIQAEAVAVDDDLSLTQQAVSKFEVGGLKSMPRWFRYAKRVVNNEISRIASPKDSSGDLDLVPVQQVNLGYGLGATILDDHPEVEVMHFPRVWIESITATPPAMLFFARGRGDSMSPSIQNDDIVIIDRSQRTIREPDLYWALTIGEMAMIKRVRVRGEVVTLLSDNAQVPNDTAHPDEINVVGRVIFIGRRV